jgi:KDO2-lipid IV(A) lauroyltransferase
MSRPSSLLHPRYWWVWLFAVPFTWLSAWLPWPVQRVVGNLLGDLTWLVAAGRRRVTLTNLRLCFPARDEAWRRQVARESFRNAAISLFESGWAWWRPVPVLARRLRVEGVENLQAARAQGRGILILGAHFTTLEFIGAAATPTVVVDTVYRPQNNAALEALVHARRSRYYGRQIDRRDVRGVFRALKENRAVWYTGDQDFGMRQAVFAPFFGVPAATVTAATRFARHNDSVALPVNFRRERDGSYVLCFEPPIAGFGADEAADAAAMNRHIEQGILKAPGQYMWFHRRFKSTPPGEASRYARAAH